MSNYLYILLYGCCTALSYVVCAADGVPADRWMIFCVMEIWKTAARADGKAIHNLMEKDKPFPTGLQTAFPQPRNSGSLRTFPQRLLLRLSILSYPILKNTMEILL